MNTRKEPVWEPLFDATRVNVRKYVGADYPTLVEWWTHWKTPVAPRDELCDTGFVVEYEGKPLLFCWLILTNARFAFIETMCASPETSWEDREYLIGCVVSAIGTAAKELGFRRLIATPMKERLAGKLELAGFRDQGRAGYFVKEL